MKPSVFAQVQATAVDSRRLLESPRHWNAGLLRYQDRLWMTYRYHLREEAGRCATAIVELDEKFEPVGAGQRLMLSGPTGTEHHEDARLFMLGGKVHVSYTEMRGYRPGVDYTCVMKYAELRLRGRRWEVVRAYHPQFGRNDGRQKEKNWVFFETPTGLHAVYESAPRHIVIRLEADRVVENFVSASPAWNFGQVRGGTPPLLQPDGTFLSVFHSSLPTEIPPHYVRYYAGAYSFAGVAPFAPQQISTRPILAGSEEDGHKVDPRLVDGWKPLCVFPCGLSPDTDGWLMSFGINDWGCAIARVAKESFHLGAADGSQIPARYFLSENAAMPVRVRDESGDPKFLHWSMLRNRPGRGCLGIMKSDNPREAQEVFDYPNVQEIEKTDYETKLLTVRR